MANKPHIHGTQYAREQVVTIRAKTLHDSSQAYKDIMRTLETEGVRAPLPETFSISTGNEVNQLFDIFKFGTKIAQFSGLVNANYDRGFSERNYWRSIENQELTVELEFNAYYSSPPNFYKAY